MQSSPAAREVEEFFHAQIPLTRAMGVRVVFAEPGRIAIEAPVAQNSNHLQTAFGGSINVIATLAGYGVLWLALREDPVHVVVAESTIRFLLPVRETIRATCALPAAAEMAAFRARLQATGKSRIQLWVTIEENDTAAAEFTGLFIARRN